MKLVVIVLLTFLVACAPTSPQNQHTKIDYNVSYKDEAIKIYSTTARGIGNRTKYIVYYVYKNALIIDMIEKEQNGNASMRKVGVYSPTMNVAAEKSMSAVYGNLDKPNPYGLIEFTEFKNSKFVDFLNDIVQRPNYYTNGAGNENLRKYLCSDLPYLTYDAKYEGEKSGYERIEGKRVEKLKEAGLSLDLNTNDSKFITDILSLVHLLADNKTLLVAVKPRYIDNSGYYQGEELVDYVVNFDQKQGIYTITLEAKNFFFKYDFSLPQKTFNVVYDGKKHVLEPEVQIDSRKFKYLEPNVSFSDKNIQITLKKIIKESSDSANGVGLFYNVKNDTINSIQVINVAIYLNDVVVYKPENQIIIPQSQKTLNFIATAFKPSASFEMLKQKKSITGILAAVEDTNQAIYADSIAKFMGQSLTRKKSQTIVAKVGIAVDYIVGGEKKTVYGSKDILLSDMIH